MPTWTPTVGRSRCWINPTVPRVPTFRRGNLAISRTCCNALVRRGSVGSDAYERTSGLSVATRLSYDGGCLGKHVGELPTAVDFDLEQAPPQVPEFGLPVDEGLTEPMIERAHPLRSTVG